MQLQNDAQLISKLLDVQAVCFLYILSHGYLSFGHTFTRASVSATNDIPMSLFKTLFFLFLIIVSRSEARACDKTK